jgi:hypothetical protein
MTKRERILVVLLTVSVCFHFVQAVVWWFGLLALKPLAAAPVDKVQANEKAVWHTKSMAIADTGYTAFVGPWVYEGEKDRSPDRYSLSVEVPIPNGSRPLYHIDLRADVLPLGFVDKPIEDIVVYDPKTRLISFNVGDRLYGFRLPEPQK